MRFGKMPSSCLCFCKVSALNWLFWWLLAGLAWLLAGFLAGLVWLLAGFLAGLAPGWLSGWFGLAPGWFGLAPGWFGLAPGWLSGWFGPGWFGLAPGWLSGWFGLAPWLVWLGFLFFPCFFSSPCRNAAAGHFASISRGHYFAATRLHAAF